jgi:leucyl-tRNA synthetase
VYRLVTQVLDDGEGQGSESWDSAQDDSQGQQDEELAKELSFVLNRTIKKVGDDISERFNFNTAISSIMELVNALYKLKDSLAGTEQLRSAVDDLILLLSPFAPHLAEELWELAGHEGSVGLVAWPEYDESAFETDSVEIVVQIAGKVKDKINVASGLDKDSLIEAALEQPRIKELIDGKQIVKTIAVPDKLVNIVVK